LQTVADARGLEPEVDTRSLRAIVLGLARQDSKRAKRPAVSPCIDPRIPKRDRGVKGPLGSLGWWQGLRIMEGKVCYTCLWNFCGVPSGPQVQKEKGWVVSPSEIETALSRKSEVTGQI